MKTFSTTKLFSIFTLIFVSLAILHAVQNGFGLRVLIYLVICLLMAYFFAGVQYQVKDNVLKKLQFGRMKYETELEKIENIKIWSNGYKMTIPKKMFPEYFLFLMPAERDFLIKLILKSHSRSRIKRSEILKSK